MTFLKELREEMGLKALSCTLTGRETGEFPGPMTAAVWLGGN